MSQKMDFLACQDLSSDILDLARQLSIPSPVLASLPSVIASLPKLPLAALSKPHTAQKAWSEITALLPTYAEDGGLPLLAATLGGACFTREEYRRQGIGEDVYFATMLCLPRFLRETYEITGRWGYDRGFWTWRQTGRLLFRLGELEFEYRLTERNEPLPEGLQAGDPILSVHIPSDAKLTREKLDASYTWAKRFFSEVPGPWISEKPRAILCGTWLLSPELYGLLSENSGIRRFADDYSLYHIQQNDNAIYRWLYQLSGPVSAEKLPERTSLQRSVKGHLLSGGLIGIAWGILKD